MKAVDQNLMSRWSALSSATIHEAAKKAGALPAAIKPLTPNLTLAGPALPVSSPPGDNLWLHRAIYVAAPGEVLVIDTSGGIEFGYWGEVMAVAAQQRMIAGVVITGGVRDSQRMVKMGFPVFSGAVCIRGTGKSPTGRGTIGEPITIGEVPVHRGDFVFGDADGVVVIPVERAAEVISESERRDTAEIEIFSRLRAGDTTIDIYDLPREAQS
jgi:4-hydroxy-4-methyl-2-oxoglutarate aldolase